MSGILALTAVPLVVVPLVLALIFAATLPLALLTWALSAVKAGGIPERGPVARAWSQARIITPMIFAA